MSLIPRTRAAGLITVGALALLAVLGVPGEFVGLVGPDVSFGEEFTDPAVGTPAQAAPTRIETTAAKGSDRAIERRLRGIFDELDGLADLEITSSGGIVELSGESLSAESRQQALRLARQVSGVVEVIDRIEEVRDVKRRLGPVVDRLMERGWQAVAWLPLFAIAACVAIAFGLVAWVIGRWDTPFRYLTRNSFLAELAQHLVRGAIVLSGILIGLDVLDATALVGTVLGAAGILGLALGFALRDTVENYIASLLLSLRQPFGHDDIVVVEGWEGRVLRLTSRATLLMTIDGNHVRIPNAIVYKSVIVNYTRNPHRRFQFLVEIGTDQEVTAAQCLGAETLAKMNGVADDPPPMATVENLGDSSVILGIYGWVDQRQADFLKVRSEAIRLVKQAYDAAGITMPEPQYLVRLSGEAAVAGAARERNPVPPQRQPRGPTVAIDIAPKDPLERQIRGERRGFAQDDLLAPDAPRE